MPVPPHIDAIIFDIGNVLIDIDYEIMVTEFARIAAIDFREIVTYSAQDHIFDLYEKGRISSADFRTALRKYLKPGVSDAEIDTAWNSILIHYPAAKFDLLKKLRKDYKLYALSNINDLHLNAINDYVQKEHGVTGMSSYFDHAYYSHELGHRKPEKEIYQLVLDTAGLDPSHTLFIDDKKGNTDAAALAGMHTHHLADRDSLLDFFSI